MLRRALGVFLCLTLILLTAFSIAEETENFTIAGFDGQDSTHDWVSNGFFSRMQERTGLSLTLQQYSDSAQWQTAKNKMFASGGELPDALFKAALTTREQIAYSESGQLIDLKPLLEENAPNLWAILQENPDWLTAITLPSGKIAALPELQPRASQNAMWINQTWLDALGLAMPTDFESLREVLTAFKTRDPNQNGKADEIPLAFLGPWELKFLSHAYGVAVNDYNIYLDDAGIVHYWPDEDSFFALAKTLQELYKDRLIDKDGFYTADTLRRVTDDKAAVTYGIFFAPTPLNLLTVDMAKSYVLLEPLVYEGKQVYRDLYGHVTRGSFAITSACSDPAALLKWVDTLYTEEGAIEAMVGTKDVDYIVDEDGYWQWKGGVSENTSAALSVLSIYDTGSMPWIFPQAFYERYAEPEVRRLSDELSRLTPSIVKPFPTYTLTVEQSDKLLPLQNALGAYVDESLARFVIGQDEINEENIAAFRAQLRSLGMEQMIEFWQNLADAMKN